MSQAYCDSSIAWLEAILSERFGGQVSISQYGAWSRLSLRGSPKAIRFFSDSATFTRNDSDLPIAYWDGIAEGWHVPGVLPLPAPGASRLPDPLIQQHDAGYTVGYDVLGLTYWMLSRQEEVAREDLDEHGRFPATASHAFKHHYLERPVVDEWLNVVGQVLQRLCPEFTLKEHRFSIRVSHDVDGPSRYGFSSFKQLARTMVGDIVKRRQFCQAMMAPVIRYKTADRLHAYDPANTFDWIMDVSERCGLTSAFYFICGRTDPARDALYDPEHKAIRDLMRRIHRRGHEIGLHPSYNTYRDPGAIKSEAARLRRICQEENIRQTVWGGRMHYLRWSTPTTLYGWERACMTYDSSLSYADLPGFRCGTCFEYPAFDPVRRKRLKLRIRPLIAMECTIMAPRYLNLGTSAASLERFTRLREACRSVDGCFTLLWHNAELATKPKRTLYRNVLTETSAV